MRQEVQSRSRSIQQQLRLAALRLAGASLRSMPPPHAPRSILLIRPDHLGDVLLLTPALHALRGALPAAHLTLMVGPWGAEAVRNNPDVDEVRALVFPGFERRPKGGLAGPYRKLWREAQRLRTDCFDAAVILRFDHWWGAWLAALARIPRRIGYDWTETRPFLTEAVPYVAGRHEALQNAGLLQRLAPLGEPLGPTRFTVTAEDRTGMARWLAAAGIGPEETLIAIHPGAGAPVKQWPVQQWAVVGRALHERLGVRLVVTGGPAEQPLAHALTMLLPEGAFNAAGRTTLSQLAALYARSRLVLGADSGPLHLAVAAGIPTVHLYGPVPVAKFGPWGDPTRHIVIESSWGCAPCNRLDWPESVLKDHGCIVTLPAEPVLRAAFSLLEDNPL